VGEEPADGVVVAEQDPERLSELGFAHQLERFQRELGREDERLTAEPYLMGGVLGLRAGGPFGV